MQNQIQNRYLVFTYRTHHASGGGKDFYKAFSDKEKALEIARAVSVKSYSDDGDPLGNSHVFDVLHLQVIAEFEKGAEYHE